LTLALILLGLTGPAAAQNVSVQLTPQGVPIQIPASGGSFNYIIAATNNGATPQRATVWCMITLPNGNPYGPVLGPVRITLSPGQTIERQRTQNVSAQFLAGNYSYNAYIGVYPDSIWDSDSFPFEKLDFPGGTELWVARYNGPENHYDEALSIAIDGHGNVCVTGISEATGEFNYEYATLKYDAAGNQLWEARYSGPTYYPDRATCLAIDGNGNVYVTGYSHGGATYYDYATIKYNAYGGQLWVARYSAPGNTDDRAHAIAVDAVGNAYVTGRSPTSSYYDYVTIKYNPWGEQQWLSRYDGPANNWDVATSIAVDGAGNVYVTGYSDALPGYETNYDYATIKYDAFGNQIWVARYDGPGNHGDKASSLAVDGDGNVYVTGYCTANQTYPWNTNYATLKYDATGNQIWVAIYDGPANGDDMANSLAIDESGNVYITGMSSNDYATLKYNTSGQQQWIARYDNPSYNLVDVANSLAVDGAGNVYVTGYSASSTSGAYGTIKYDSSGNQIWVAHYSGPVNGGNAANSLAADNGGNVYVTGRSEGNGTDWDYSTIKYSGGDIANWMPVEATVLGQSAWGGPQEFRLEQNYPNPFNASTVLNYQLPVASHVRLQVYDTAGRLVETLVDGWRTAGEHELTLDTSQLPSGMYFAKFEAGDYAGVQKMMLVK
jgi:uncharacterized delta-60 repeat protein